jgi:hypothetical protein
VVYIVAVKTTEITSIGIRHADHVAPSIRKSSPTSGCRSVGIIRSGTQVTEFVFFCLVYIAESFLQVTEYTTNSYFINSKEANSVEELLLNPHCSFKDISFKHCLENNKL